MLKLKSWMAHDVRCQIQGNCPLAVPLMWKPAVTGCVSAGSLSLISLSGCFFQWKGHAAALSTTPEVGFYCSFW